MNARKFLVVMALVMAVIGLLVNPGSADVLSVPFFSQNDPQWKDDLVVNRTMSIGESPGKQPVGCAMDALAMFYSFAGAQATPKTLNRFFNTNGVYDTNGYISSWERAATYAEGNRSFLTYHPNGPSTLTTPNDVRNLIDSGFLLVARSNRFSGGHWVAIKGYVPRTGQLRWSDFIYLDPWDSPNRPNFRQVGDNWVMPGNTIRKFTVRPH